MTLTIGSLFSGMGALDLAVAQVFDAEPVWFCEIVAQRLAQEVLFV